MEPTRERTLGPEPSTGEGEEHLQERLAWYASVARLAPSKHNSQPWRFVVGDGVLEVWPDLERRLTATDPRARELVVSCGAAVHCARVAAGALGATLDVTPWPRGGAGPVAVLREGHRVPVSDHARALLAAVTRRHTDRGPLDASALPSWTPFVLQNAAAWHGCTLRLVQSEGERRTLARIVEIADRHLAQDPAVDEELHAWVAAPGDTRRDGVPATATRGQRRSYSAEFVQRDFGSPEVEAAHDRPGKDAPIVGILCTPGDLPADWLRAGEALMAVLLSATVAGGNASYLNQPVEVAATRSMLQEELQLPGTPQVVLRLGAGGHVLPTPRRSASEVVVRT